MGLAQNIADHFLVYDMKWSFDGEQRYPTADEVQFNLDKAAAALYDHKDGTSLVVGGMIIHKNAGHLDTYLYFGDYNDEAS